MTAALASSLEPLALVADSPAPEGSGLARTDLDIKELAVTSRRAALDLLVRRYGEKLYVHALYILHDAQEARDVAQEVFIKAMREPRLYDEDFKIQAWLYRVTRNLCFNLVRDRRRRHALLEAGPKPDSTAPDPLQAVFHGEQQHQILEAVGALTADHRDILMLRYYEDLSYQEIADRLQIKLGTVMSRLSRARDRLVEALGTDSPLQAA